jgi:alkaline phosphatase D
MKKILIIFFIALHVNAKSQELISGPMLGYVEHQTACIWLEPKENTKEIIIQYWPLGMIDKAEKEKIILSNNSKFNPTKIELNGLKINTEYEYKISVDGKFISTIYKLKTKRVYAKWSKTEPANFSVMIGSCLYLNDSIYDRPGTPYGKDPQILNSMANTSSDFMIWLGDNLYLREADWSSAWGIKRRYSVNRANPFMKNLLSKQPNYATWDDHDFGPNDSNNSYDLSYETTNCFKSYWANKTYGKNGKGVYSKFNYEDAEFFLLDNRSFRDANQLHDSINGKINLNKDFLGKEQMQWLKNSLASSESPFKIVVCGSQVFNGIADKECYTKYTGEFNELIDFIRTSNISGLIFISGDRHFTELLKTEGIAKYPIYEFTNSPITSTPYSKLLETAEAKNPKRVEGSLFLDNNFGKLNFSGTKKERTLTFETYDKSGNKVWEYSIKSNDIK